MSKKPIFFAIISNCYGFQIMYVTSETQRHLYGSINNVGTHCRITDLKAKFETLYDAEQAKNGIRDIVIRYKAEYAKLNEKMNELHQQEYREIKDYLNGKA